MSKHLKDDVDVVSKRVHVLERELEWHGVGVEIGAGLEGMKERGKGLGGREKIFCFIAVEP